MSDAEAAELRAEVDRLAGELVDVARDREWLRGEVDRLCTVANDVGRRLSGEITSNARLTAGLAEREATIAKLNALIAELRAEVDRLAGACVEWETLIVRTNAMQREQDAASVRRSAEWGATFEAQRDEIARLAGLCATYADTQQELFERCNAWAAENECLRMDLAARDAGPLTIARAQRDQPWVLPYSAGVELARQAVPHILASHCVLHASKSVGKLAAVFESLDHNDRAITDAELSTIRAMSADLMTAALRFANLYGFDLEAELVARVTEKNGVGSERGRVPHTRQRMTGNDRRAPRGRAGGEHG